MAFGGSTSLPRKVTPMGTAGEMGQLFTVYEKNWHCPDCNQENYASRTKCSRCRKQKPASAAGDYVMDPALEALKAGKEIAWQEVIDPASKQIYYYNKSTGATQWERPAELGEAPLATGWFGRGQVGSNAAQRFAELNAQYLARPARRQKEFIDPKKYHIEGANEYNIWYGKFLGDGPDHGKDREAAADKCNLATDAGCTKADSGGRERKDKRYFCVHFAHGVCAKGHECTFYHRIPTPEDDGRCDEMFDCFGRQKHNAHRDDMNGVGSFMKPCRTLFVGNLLKQKYETPKALENACWKAFEEWGELESCNVIHRLSIAFPRYRLRTSAEFAKEAMSQQSLGQGEILSIRWAHDDPNPVAQEAISRADKDALAALLQAKGVSLKESAFDHPLSYQVPQAIKKLRAEDGSSVAVDEAVAYPDTVGQYQVEGYFDPATQAAYPVEYASYFAQWGQSAVTNTPDVAGPGSAASGIDESISDILARKQALLSGIVSLAASSATAHPVPTSTASSEPVADIPGKALGSAWTEHVDEETGATYFYNEATGESSWGEEPGANDSL